MSSITLPISRSLSTSVGRHEPPPFSPPPLRLQACWEWGVDGDGRRVLVCRWVQVPI